MVEPAVASRAPHPALSCVRFHGGTIEATDGDLSITVSTPAAGRLSALVPFARIKAIASALPPLAPVSMTATATGVKIASGSSSWALQCVPEAEWPARPASALRPVCRLPGDHFSRLAKTAKTAAGSAGDRPALQAMLVEVVDGEVHLLATDGHRLVRSSAELDQAVDNSSTLIPDKAAAQLIRLAAAAEAIQLETSGSELVATLGGTVVRCRTVNATFPDWRKHSPATTDWEYATARVDELLSSVRQAQVTTSPTSHSVALDIGETLVVTGESPEYGRSRVECPLLETGKAIRLAVNPRFITDWLATIDPSEAIDIRYADGNSAIVLRSEDSLCLIATVSQ
jgi:DNA polymerase-3 subunit beta